MCSARASRIVELAAGDGDRGEVRRRLDAVGHGAVADRPQRAPLDAAARRAGTSRRPSMSAPIATSMSQRSTTSGSRAAFSIVVVAVGEHRRRDDVLGRARRSGTPNTMSAPCSRSARRLELAVAELELGTHLLQPGDVHVDRAGAEVVAAGHRQPDLARNASSSGPSTLIDARIRSTCSYGATGVRSPSFVSVSRPGSGRRRR